MIVLDIDGVVADMHSELIYTLRSAGLEIDDIEQWPDYHWRNIAPKIDPDVLHSFLINPIITKNCKPFRDAWLWANHHSERYDIMYLTAREESLSQYTWDWLFSWDLPADFVVFEKNKPQFLASLQVDVYIDDYPDMISQSRDLGVNAYLLNRPYNMNADIPDEFRINSLWELDFE